MQDIQDFAQKLMSPDDVHGWGHVLRVVKLCEEIAQQEPCNKDILLAAAYLHDIGRAIENKPNKKGINHAILSQQLAMPFMIKVPIIPADAVPIGDCIRSHCFSAGIPPETIEAKILSDADKIDAMGAIGIYRMIVFQMPSNKGIAGIAQHLDEKLLKLKDQLYTATAKKMAPPRHKLLVAFREELRQEFKI
jgi:uncharacterized protein